MRRPLSAALVLLVAACGEAGLPLPRDPGTVQVRVRDEQAAPVPGANVRIQMPNNSGGLFEVGSTTRADGTWTVSAVPAGRRRVTVTPPTGYAQGAEPLVRVVEVIADRTVQVDFVLRRSVTPPSAVGKQSWVSRSCRANPIVSCGA
ncbi:MAG: carboxypeptidase-like regulatory domain-containing protein [Gemmatirosa sp.]